VRELFREADRQFGAHVLQRLQRHVQSDLVAMLEAVRHGLGDAVHAQLHAVTLDRLDALGVDAARHLYHLDRRVVDARGT
jgi:hypothetical protein